MKNIFPFGSALPAQRTPASPRFFEILRAHLIVPFLLAVLPLFSIGALAEVPVVFRVSEGVRPSSIVSLYGEFLTGSPTVRFLGADGSVAATQPAVQTDPGGHFIRVVFPSIAPGAYRLSVKNDQGWATKSVFLNRADPRWISEERAYPGLPLKLIGRNLDAREYGGHLDTKIRLFPLKSNGRSTIITPDSVNPYCVDFSIPAGTAFGDYQVAVLTGSAEHGRDWVELNNHSELPDTVRTTVIKLEPPPTNATALELKVPWANDFVWTRRVNAKTEFGAKGDGATDDTQAIQKALDQVASQSGGVVFLPNGNYRVSSLVLAGKSVLQGESRAGTVVMVSKTEDTGAIVTQGSAHGISTLTLKYQPGVPASSQGMLLGGAASKLFLHNTTFDLLRDPDVSAKQGPYYVSGDGPMLVANCQFFISSRNLWNHQVKNRVTFRNNFVDMHDGLGLCMSSEKLLVLDNELVFHAAPYAGQMNGFFLNEGWMGWNIYNAYIAGNNAHDLLGPGDCQPSAADSAWSCLAGAVTGSSADTVDVRNDVSADFKNLETREIELVVVQGKGLGQLRRMKAHQNLGGNPAVVRFAVSPPWDVPPDTTSLVSAGSWHVNNVFYRNLASGSKSPYNMYYGGSYDCVDADAVSENTEGWYNWGRIGEYPKGSWHCPVYFSQLKRSEFNGLAPKYETMGITLRVENETTNYWGVADYGTEIRDNTIDRAACSNKNQRLAGNAAIATFNQCWKQVTREMPLLFGTLCEGNTIKNSAVGFDLNGSSSFAIRGTVYENCPKPVNDHGHDTILLPGAPVRYAPPSAALPRQFERLRNPVWVSEDNLRDPSVLKTGNGYRIFYSRFSGGATEWGESNNWHIAEAFTKDWLTFENKRDVSPAGCASPGDVVKWGGRWLLPYQTYPGNPAQLVFAESEDLESWSQPKPFLTEALDLPWNGLHRVIDPSFVVDGDTLHCFFVGSAGHVNAVGKRVHANLIGHAITRDSNLSFNLSNWEILSREEPLIGWSERAPDGVENAMVFKTGGRWTMIYSEGLADQHLALATSADLRAWKLEGTIELPRQKWIARKYGAPFVWRVGPLWAMLLMGTNDKERTTLGLLTSPDGRRWTLLPE